MSDLIAVVTVFVAHLALFYFVIWFAWATSFENADVARPAAVFAAEAARGEVFRPVRA